MININQFALYQLKQIAENRSKRFRSYQTLQEQNIRVCCENYEQKYIGRMLPEDTPESIRLQFQKQTPRTFRGHSISVSDVLVLNKAGVVMSYYVDKTGFVEIAGFIRNSSSGALVSIETREYHIEGKKGKWLAFDSIILDGREFFLMEHCTYGKNAAWVVLDEQGVVVVDNVHHGFDETVLKQIREYISPTMSVPEVKEEKKPPLENWQKFYENGEYMRTAEISEEQNYNMIDGRMNNLPPKPRKIGKRVSVLDRLHLKQAEIEKRSGQNVPQREM